MRAILAVLLSILPARALAQADEAYAALVREAVAEFDAHRFEEARALFRQAHARAPSARTLRGIGLASFEMGDYVEAHRALEASLADPRRPLTEGQRAVVAEVLARAHRFVGRYALELAPDDAVVRVDGAPALRGADGRLVLGLGAHEVSAEAPGHAPARERVVVGGGEEGALRLSLAPVAAAVLAPPPPAPPAAPVVGRDATPALAALIAGGAVAGGALVVGLAWWLPRDEEVARCADAGSECFNLAELTEVRDAAAATTLALAVLGAGGLALGAGLFASTTVSEPGVACAPAGPALVCAGRF